MRHLGTCILIGLASASLPVSRATRATAQAIGAVNVWRAQGGGRFTVGSFLPWNGYRIPNGVWLTGDFNRDSLTDLVHLVQNTNYVHVWLARGNGTFDVRPPFSPSPTYVIPNGQWLVGDVNGDQRTDLIHVVQNTNYANIWLSRGNGTFDVRPFSPWPSYSMPNGEWQVGDFNGDGAADLIHLVQNTNYAHVWLSRRDGTFDVKPPFSPWPDYVISNGQWIVGDFDNDGRADLAHLVPNERPVGPRPTASVNVWRGTVDGTFRVTTFTPWPDYVIPNGDWLAGDFDGDGRTDLLHLVNNADYANVWLSLGSGRFNVVQYRPWSGYVMSNNGPWRAGQFDRDGRADVVHLLRSDNADIAQISGNRYETIALSPNRVDSILADATAVLRTKDYPDDVTCELGFIRRGNIAAFNTFVGGVAATATFDGTISN